MNSFGQKFTLRAGHSGTCYPQDAVPLRVALDEAIHAVASDPTRPSPPHPDQTDPLGWIIPHIDFRVNLSLYALAFHDILRHGVFPETWWILGVGHRCPHEFSMVSGAFRTPLGTVMSDDDTLLRIEEACGFPLCRSPESFDAEHSIEFALVWLQALRDLYFPGRKLKIVPVLMGGLWPNIISGKPPGRRTQFGRLGKTIAGLMAEGGSGMLASIDGCHVGPRFHHSFPVDEQVKKTVESWESTLWDMCRSDRVDDFFQHLGSIQNGFYFDGAGVLTLLLQNCHTSTSVLSRALWYEPADRSMVSFTAARMEALT